MQTAATAVRINSLTLTTAAIALLALNVHSATVGRRQPLWIKKHECPGQPYPVSKVLDCRLINFRGDPQRPQEINVVFEFDEPQRRVQAEFAVFVQHQRTRSTLYGTTLDYCRFIEEAESGTNKVAELLVNIARKNVPQVLRACPYEGVVNATGVVMGSDMVLPYVLPGSYRTEIRFFNKKNQTLIAWNTDFELRNV